MAAFIQRGPKMRLALVAALAVGSCAVAAWAGARVASAPAAAPAATVLFDPFAPTRTPTSDDPTVTTSVVPPPVSVPPPTGTTGGISGGGDSASGLDSTLGKGSRPVTRDPFRPPTRSSYAP